MKHFAVVMVIFLIAIFGGQIDLSMSENGFLVTSGFGRE